jgi:competence protein ComEA
LPPSRRRLLVAAWLLLTLAGIVRLAARVVDAERSDERQVATPRQVDINRAPVSELMTLPGIGSQRARAIVLHRVRHGPFTRTAELAEVDGLGPVRVRELAPHLCPLPGDAPH